MLISQITIVLLGISVATALPSVSGRDSSLPPFNPSEQLVKTTGRHAFRPPGPNDARGPCPGLNAMANHGYLPRNGFATIPQFIHGCKTVFGMGTDLATVLAIFGAVIDGNGIGWSIGGEKYFGISGSHNNYEGDRSPFRGDLNQYGSNENVIMSQFYDLYNLQPDAATANYDLDILAEFGSKRFNDSVAKNPKFFYALFAGPVVSQAAFTFIYRFMSNKSAEMPEGRLDKKILKSFTSIHGPEHNLTWIPGHERIPDNFYTRNPSDAYNLNYLTEDSNYLAKDHPEVLLGGCNMGTVNSYTRIRVLPSRSKDGESGKNDPLCTGLKYAVQTSMKGGLIDGALEQVITPVLSSLGCSTALDLDFPLGLSCPGFSLYGGPTGKIAKGAIQDE